LQVFVFCCAGLYGANNTRCSQHATRRFNQKLKFKVCLVDVVTNRRKMMQTIFRTLCLACTLIVIAGAEEPNWNQFRGPNHDNHSFTKGIAKQWSADGPKLLWKVDTLGTGYSNLSFDGDTMYTLGDIQGKCRLLALNKADAKERWSIVVGGAGAPGGYVGPRSTPAVDDKNVFAFGQFGDFVCVDKKDGKEIWGGNVTRELGGKPMNIWGYASSPIFDNDKVILPIGGKDGTLVAFAKNGQRVWRSGDLKDDAPYCSAVPVVIGNVRQYLLFTLSGLHGIDVKNGGVLWKVDRFKDKPVCSDPIYVAQTDDDGIAFVSSHYDMGANGYEIKKSGPAFFAKEIYADQQLPNHHGGIVLVGEHAYFTNHRELVCLDVKTGKIAWKNRSVGKGSVSFVDGYLIVRSEAGDGEIALVEANPSQYVEKGRFVQPDRSDKNSWTYPVIVDGKMYIRDQNVLLCYDLMQ
jgi:outer membrane protein assembly factor BamB